LGLLLVALAVPGLPARAQPSPGPARHRAALVVVFADGRLREFCVPFREDRISGFEVLRRSGLDLRYEVHGGGDITVCRIEGVGADFPREDCFARCKNVNQGCVFWGYYRLDPKTKQWTFPTIGAADTVVRDGAVEAWRWGEQGVGGGNPPPEAAFERICANPVATRRAARTGPSGPSPAALATLGAIVAAVVALGVARARARRAAP
jgi:hypothetical protein